MARALAEKIRPWSGPAFRHIPAEGAHDVRDLRFAGRRGAGRWHWQGQRTLYLASDAGVAIGEFARHLAVDRGGSVTPARRAVYEVRLDVDRALDLREQSVLAMIGRDDAPACWLDERIARATATFFRDTLDVQALIVPSVAYLDDPGRFNIVAFLENLPERVRTFLPRARRRSTVTVEPAEAAEAAGDE